MLQRQNFNGISITMIIKMKTLHSAAKCNNHVFSTSTAEYNKIAVN